MGGNMRSEASSGRTTLNIGTTQSNIPKRQKRSTSCIGKRITPPPPEQQDTTMADVIPESWQITEWNDLYDISSAAVYNYMEYAKDSTSKLTVTVIGATLIASDTTTYYKE